MLLAPNPKLKMLGISGQRSYVAPESADCAQVCWVRRHKANWHTELNWRANNIALPCCRSVYTHIMY